MHNTHRLTTRNFDVNDSYLLSDCLSVRFPVVANFLLPTQ